MSSWKSSSRVKQLYKELLGLARGLPDAKQRDTIVQEIQQKFRKSGHEGASMDAATIQKLIETAESKLGYLKIISPRKRGIEKGQQNFVYTQTGCQEVVRFGSKEKAKYQVVDMEAAYKRNHQLLRRQHFLDRK